MKYILGIIIGVLILSGAYYGFTVWENGDDNSGGSVNIDTEDTTSTSNAKILDLSNNMIKEVTADVYNKTGVTELLLSNNSIRTLPSEMGKMTNLVTFKIDHNILEGSLIGEIRQMSNLRVLDVSYNSMTGMPAEIGQLNKLESLDYSFNKITGLPNEIANLKNNLKQFNLTGNPLSQEQIENLKMALPNTTIIF